MRGRHACLALVLATATLAGCPGGGQMGPSVSDANATDRALAAEEAYVSEHLSTAECVTEWGTDPTVVDRNATVTNRTADSVAVTVTQPYWYGTTDTEADGASEARYLVTANETTRVDGDDLSPC